MDKGERKVEASQSEREPSKWPQRLNVCFALHTSIDKEKLLLRACNLHYKWSLCGFKLFLFLFFAHFFTASSFIQANFFVASIFLLKMCNASFWRPFLEKKWREREMLHDNYQFICLTFSNFLFPFLSLNGHLYFFPSTTRTFFWPLFLAPLKREICTRLRNSSLPLPSTRTSAIR